MAGSSQLSQNVCTGYPEQKLPSQPSVPRCTGGSGNSTESKTPMRFRTRVQNNERAGMPRIVVLLNMQDGDRLCLS
ncbi:hypothetical protein E4U49_005688, partial [Claviceps purpurea]